MKRLIVALALVASLGMAGHALAMDKKINIFNGAQYDIYTLYLSPTNANDWEENLLKQETLPNGDKVDVEVSRTEKAEAWDVKVTNKAGETMTWIGVPLNKAGQITLLPDGKYEARLVYNLCVATVPALLFGFFFPIRRFVLQMSPKIWNAWGLSRACIKAY